MHHLNVTELLELTMNTKLLAFRGKRPDKSSQMIQVSECNNFGSTTEQGKTVVEHTGLRQVRCNKTQQCRKKEEGYTCKVKLKRPQSSLQRGSQGMKFKPFDSHSAGQELPVRVQSQVNLAVHTYTPLFKICFNIILPTTPISPQWPPLHVSKQFCAHF